MLVTIGKDSYEKMWNEFNETQIPETPPEGAISAREYAHKFKVSLDKAVGILERGVIRGELECKMYRHIRSNNRCVATKFYTINKVKPRHRR